MLHRDMNFLLAREKDDIISWLVDCLHQRHESRYGEVHLCALEMRARKLVESLVESTRTRELPPGRGNIFVRYVEQIAEARIAEGFDLEEVQFALSKLEEKVWQLVVTHLLPEEQARELGKATLIIGSAKDHLARVYLKRRDGPGNPKPKENLESLAKGTDPAPVSMEDDEGEPTISNDMIRNRGADLAWFSLR